MLKWLTGPSDLDRKAVKLYGAVVTAARNKAFYADLGVPDTPEGRFDLVALHLFLVLERLKDHGERGRALTQRTIETFITDMDDCMREMGVGDLVVPKKVKRAAAAFYERAGLYRDALAEASNERLVEAVRTTFDAPAGSQVAAQPIARYIRETHDRLLAMPPDVIAKAELTFPPVSS